MNVSPNIIWVPQMHMEKSYILPVPKNDRNKNCFSSYIREPTTILTLSRFLPKFGVPLSSSACHLHS